MTEAVRASLTGEALARICANAGAFVPARAETKMLALIIGSEQVEARGTDGYAAGVDYAPAHTTGGTARLALSKEDMELVERTARSQKKELVTLTVAPQRLTVQFAENGEPNATDVQALPYPGQAWGMLDSLLCRTLGEARPEFVAFDPALFSRFSKVRAEQDRVMDLWFSSAQLPVLVKIGATFRGLVMPLQRQQAAEYTPEGLW